MLKHFIENLSEKSSSERLVRGVLGNHCDISPEVEFGFEPRLIEIGNNA